MKPAHFIGAAIVGIGLILVGVIFALVSELTTSAEPDGEARLAAIEATLASQQVEIQELRRDLDSAAKDPEPLDLQNSTLPATEPELPANALPLDIGDTPPDLEYEEGAVPTTEALGEQMKLAKERFNKGIIQSKNSFMLETLGQPRDNYSTDCQPVTNPRMMEALETRQIGNFRLTMLRPALESVQRIMDRLQKDEPEIYAALGTAGALCARFIRGSTTSVSNHSWGAAVDFTLEGNLDALGDGGTQFGLVILAEFFNDEGWYWGAGYGREDSMHFEIGEDLMKKWIAEGKL